LTSPASPEITTAAPLLYPRRDTIGERSDLMHKNAVNAQRLFELTAHFGETIIDPATWPNIMEQICVAAGATGASLMWPEIALSDFPHTASLADGFGAYINEGWHDRNVRAQRFIPLLKRGQTVVTDQDVVRRDEMQRLPFYNEFLAPRGFKWFAAVGFWVESDLWVLSVQRMARQGPFGFDDKRALGQISQPLTETASLSRRVGGAVLSGIANALSLINQPVLALDRFGNVIGTNATAEDTFNDNFRIRHRRLFVIDQQAKSMLDTLTDKLRTTPDTAALPTVPIIVQRGKKTPLCLRILPVNGAARSPFLGARALIVVSDPTRKSAPKGELLLKAFGLSPAEARLCSLIATGISLDRAAEELGIAHETARNQLKAIFAKTGRHRQSELVALLSKL
jgi:DNA-binding CsgD family transcriptional regulator